MFEFKIDGLPPLPNTTRSWHWAKKAKEAKRWRIMSAYLFKKSLIASKAKIPFQAVNLYLIRGSSKLADPDNGVASFKPVIDGLRDSGAILDDGPNIVRKITFLNEPAKPKLGYIKVIVEPIDTE